MVFETIQVRQKLDQIGPAIEMAFQAPMTSFPETPGRDALILTPGELPPKKGLSYREGQARLLHDLASIELQAMELGLRTLHEYPEAPGAFREALADITASEASHLKLCLDGIEKLGFKWGDWPIHNMLWAAVGSSDSLLDRVLIVHRYLEGSGLDAGDTLLRRLDSVLESPLHGIAKTILTEEIGHVEFGSRWYRNLCELEKIDPANDFPVRMKALRYKLPKRIERLSRPLRLQAGFTESELDYLESLRREIIKHPGREQS